MIKSADMTHKLFGELNEGREEVQSETPILVGKEAFLCCKGELMKAVTRENLYKGGQGSDVSIGLLRYFTSLISGKVSVITNCNFSSSAL